MSLTKVSDYKLTSVLLFFIRIIIIM